MSNASLQADKSLSEYERKALELLRDNGPYPYLSGLGYALFAGEKEGRKRHPSPQGIALAAGRFTRALEKRELAAQDLDGRYITRKGRELLAELEAAEAQK